MYQFINEDTGTAVIYDAATAEHKQEEINKAVTKRNRLKADTKQNFFDLKNYIEQNNIDKFKKYLKSLKDEVSETPIPTGRMIYSEDKYNAKYKSIMDQKAQLAIRFNDIVNDMSRSIADKVKATDPIKKQLNELNKIVLSKDAKEFQVEEYVTIKVTPLEALKTCLSMIERYNMESDKLKQRAMNEAIKRDADSLKNVDEGDFAFIKRLYKLIDPKVFFDMFQYNHYNELKDAMLYESKDEYLNRPRDIKWDTPELSFTDEEAQSIAYLVYLKREFNSLQTEEQLQDEAKRLQDEADASMKTL
jgi:putative component of toxin-antitoxin plasmid stabilization module